MRKLMIALLALGFGTAAGAADLKIAVVDPDAAIEGTEQFKNAMSILKNDVSKDEAQLTKLQSDLNVCRQKAQKDAAMMSATDQARLKADCENKAREFQTLGQAYQSVVQERQVAVKKDIYPKLEKAFEALNAEMGYDLVLQRAATVFTKPDFDITQKLTERINAMGATQGAKPAAAAPAAAKPAATKAAPAKPAASGGK